MNEWIDAKQHKPSVVDVRLQRSSHVLTFGPKGIGVGYYHAGMKAWINARGGTLSVTHWMAPPDFPGESAHHPRKTPLAADAPLAGEQREASTEWARKIIAERFGGEDCPEPPRDTDDARAEDEAFDEVERLQRRLGHIRNAPSAEPAGRALRDRAGLEDRVARLERSLDHMLARIAMLEARLAAPPPTYPPPYPGWPNPLITC
jgi:hypothetical protein